MTIPESFVLIPLITSDARSVLRLDHQVYPSDPLHLSGPPQSEGTFIFSGFAAKVAELTQPHVHGYKLVPASESCRIVSYIVYHSPLIDSRSEEEKQRALGEEVNGLREGLDKDTLFMMNLDETVWNERFLGKGYETRWWVLDNLVTDVEYRRRGLASRLLTWGLATVEIDVKRTKDFAGDKRVEGVYVITPPETEGLYSRAGFVKVGEREVSDGCTHTWYVKRFD